MTNRWPPGTVKIHEGCGGLVRWVEAVRTPGVGYYGECLECHSERVVVEDIVPVLPDDPNINPTDVVNESDQDTLAQLDWDDDSDWDENQARFRSEVSALA
jgi:hypothetical protein